MKRINNLIKQSNQNLLIGALICGLFFLSAATTAQNAAAQTIPLGSYKQSCQDAKIEATKLIANCKPKDTGGLFSGKPFTGSTTLEKFYECDGDIWNDNSVLKCNRNSNTPKLNKARAAINQSLVSVMGKKATGENDYGYWLGQLFNNGMLGKYYYGLTESDTNAFFKKQLAKAENGNMRSGIIDAAFKDVYNFGASPKDLAMWNAELQKGASGYQEIVAVERQRLSSDKVIRRLTILAAYKKAMGRIPSKDDFDYWLPRTEIFKELVEANRNWLYSTNGAKDLAETVARALESKGGSKPTISQINRAITAYSATKAIFDEM